MRDSDTKSSMYLRYQRAALSSGPKLAARTANLHTEGYWVDARHYFFLSETFDHELDRLVTAPFIFDCTAGHAESIISIRNLERLLSRHTGKRIDIEEMLSATFDVPDISTLVVSLGLHQYTIAREGPRVIEVFPTFDKPALYSPNKRYAAFIDGDNLGVSDLATGESRPLTRDGQYCLSIGQEPSNSLSSISYRKSKYPVGLWSPDSEWFLTHRIDERSVPLSAIVQHAPITGKRPILHEFKYSMPEDDLSIVTFIAVHLRSGRVTEFKDNPVIASGVSPFSRRLVWFGSPGIAWFAHLDRYSRHAELVRLDLTQGVARTVLSETAARGYLDLATTIGSTPNIRTLEKSNEVIWCSERNGYSHLYLYDSDTGLLKNPITQGNWIVKDIVHVDEVSRRVLYLATDISAARDPAQRSLCGIFLDGSGFEVICGHDGDVFVPVTEPSGYGASRSARPSFARPGVSPDAVRVVTHLNSVRRGNSTQIVELSSGRHLCVEFSSPPKGVNLPRHFEVLAADGLTTLHGTMFLPSDFDEKLHYPLVDYVYPGPQLAWQPQKFGSMKSAPAQSLAELGMVAFMLDTRSMPVGEKSFRQASYPELLEPQMSDHAAAVVQLAKQFPFIDASRVGMVGSSGGGLATAYALCEYGHIFSIGVAASGNYDSAIYCSSWSDKYRGPEAHKSSVKSVAELAHKLRGKLLLASGDMDENVHLSQTLSFADALIRANRDFDLLIVPNAGHAMFYDNGYAQRRVWDYFVRYLLDEAPPPNFELRFEKHELTRFFRNIRLEMRQ